MDSRSANKTGTLVATSNEAVNSLPVGCTRPRPSIRRMCSSLAVCSALLLLPASVLAQGKNDAGKKAGSEAKAVSGMSIVGNNESPKSLYIVPWKGSNLGAETSLNSSLLDDSTAPVDKEVFMRALDYYELSNPN